jgi:hypothetical protein
MHKNDVPSVIPLMLNAMEQMLFINSVFSVCNASERLFGKLNTIASRDASIGLNCGSLRAVL